MERKLRDTLNNILSDGENFDDYSVNGLGSIRTEKAPKKTIIVYKLMRLDGGKLYPLFIDRSEPVKIGVWYNADAPDFDTLKKLDANFYYLMDGKNVVEKRSKSPSKSDVDAVTKKGYRYIFIEETTKLQRRFGENRKYWNVGITGSNAVGLFSMRAGWHAGSLPTMRQIGKGKNKDLRDDRFVWTECEISADIDYNTEAQQNPDKDLPTKMPENGYYLKATNADKVKSQANLIGWYVAGAIKINRIISDKEARQIIDDFNKKHKTNVLYDYERESGKEFDPKKGLLGIEKAANRNTDISNNQFDKLIQQYWFSSGKEEDILIFPDFGNGILKSKDLEHKKKLFDTIEHNSFPLNYKYRTLQTLQSDGSIDYTLIEKSEDTYIRKPKTPIEDLCNNGCYNAATIQLTLNKIESLPEETKDKYKVNITRLKESLEADINAINGAKTFIESNPRLRFYKEINNPPAWQSSQYTFTIDGKFQPKNVFCYISGALEYTMGISFDDDKLIDLINKKLHLSLDINKYGLDPLADWIKENLDVTAIETYSTFDFYSADDFLKVYDWLVSLQAHDTTLQKLELQLLDEESPLKITIETFANIVKQYNSLKQKPKYKDVILIFATSKYEQSKLCSICEKDAEIAGKILKVKPTKLGLIFSRYYLEEYLSKLTRAGYRVGIVEEEKGLKGVDNWSVTELDGINFDDNKKNPVYYFGISLNNAIFASDWNAKAYNELCKISKLIKDGIIRYERLAQERFGGENGSDRIRRSVIQILGGSRSTSTSFRASGARVSSKFERETRIVKAFAEYRNVWHNSAVDYICQLGSSYHSKGNEARIYLSKDENYVFKIKNVVAEKDNYGNSKPKDLLKFFDELTNHNILFPETKYEILGFGLDENNNFCTILKQKAIKGQPATLQQIEKYFLDDNFKKSNSTTYYRNGFVISDLKPSNVVYNNEKCYVIDCFAQNLFDFDDNFYINQTINNLGSIVSEPTKQTFYENLYKQLESIVKDDSFEKNGIRNFILSHIPEDYKNDDIEGIVEVFYQRLRALKYGEKGLGEVQQNFKDLIFQIGDLINYKGFEETIFQIVDIKKDHYIVRELGDRTQTWNEIPFSDKDKLEKAVSPLLIEEIKLLNNNNSLSGIVQPFYPDHDTDDYLNDYSESKSATQAFLDDVKNFVKRLKKDLELEDYYNKGKKQTITINARDIYVQLVIPYAEKPNTYLRIEFHTNHLLWQYKGLLKGINYDYNVEPTFTIWVGEASCWFNIWNDYDDILKELKYKYSIFRDRKQQTEVSPLLTKELQLLLTKYEFYQYLKK